MVKFGYNVTPFICALGIGRRETGERKERKREGGKTKKEIDTQTDRLTDRDGKASNK